MATTQSLLSEAQCVACSGTATLFQTLEIQILLNILASQGTPMTQAELQAASNCFVCYGMSQAEAAILVLLNALSSSAAITGGVEGRFGNYAGGQPDWTPTGDVALAYDISTAPATQWIWYDNAWH